MRLLFAILAVVAATVLSPVGVFTPVSLSHVHAACDDEIVPAPGCTTQIRGDEKATNGGDQINNTLNALWARAMSLVFLGLGIAGVIMLILAGIRYTTAAGSPEVVKQARQQIVSVVLGLFLLGTSYLIVNLILSVITTAGKG